MNHFDRYMQHFSEVEGWFQTPAIASGDSLLSYQHERKISATCLRSACGKENL
jgi:hypothetical protein